MTLATLPKLLVFVLLGLCSSAQAQYVIESTSLRVTGLSELQLTQVPMLPWH